MNWAEKRKIFDANQSGFHKGHSTQDNIFKIAETCKNGIKKGLKCGIVLFDIEKAFDKAPHKEILASLNKYRCPILVGKWLQSFYLIENFSLI